MKKEEAIQIRFCNYLKKNHPSVLFTADLSGENVSIHQARKNKMQRSNRGFPDLMIFEPRGVFNGLFVELKRDGVRLWKRDGTAATDHIREQFDMILELRKRKYCAEFAVGIGEALKVINNYFGW